MTDTDRQGDIVVWGRGPIPEEAEAGRFTGRVLGGETAAIGGKSACETAASSQS